MRMPTSSVMPMASIFIALTACPTAHGKEQGSSAASVASVGALLTGLYENSEQVAQGKAAATRPAPQHVTVTIEPTPRADWEIWHVHMDVDPAVAQSAGSDTSLDAVWAMKISRRMHDKSLSLIPYTLRPSVGAETVRGSAFDESQWLSLEACLLRGEFGRSRIIAQAAVDEMCVAEAMGLGGKRAFLPSWIECNADRLQVQLIYFGEPWRVDARRVK